MEINVNATTYWQADVPEMGDLYGCGDVPSRGAWRMQAPDLAGDIGAWSIWRYRGTD